jgi:hypothetical protein
MRAEFNRGVSGLPLQNPNPDTVIAGRKSRLSKHAERAVAVPGTATLRPAFMGRLNNKPGGDREKAW